MHPYHFPTNTTIAAALETLLDQAARGLASCDSRDRAYWTRQAEAYRAAAADLAAGRRPLDGDGYYLVPSSSSSYTYHKVEKTRGYWRCSCPARVFCRHAAMVGAVELAGDLAERELVGALVPDDQPDDNFDDVGPEEAPRAPSQLGRRLAEARALRYAA